VTRLPDGERRMQQVERDVAATLVSYGLEHRSRDFETAATAWTMAATYDPDGRGMTLIRSILLPPENPEIGASWRSELDRAELVYLPPTRTRVGCSDSDRRCRQNEIYFRWFELPGFWIEKHEVSNARYRLCVEAGDCTPPLDDFRFTDRGRDQDPVVGVTWYQARDFASWVGRRLPSEAQWERAARAGDQRWRYPWGNSRRVENANVWADEPGVRTSGTKPVGSFPATGPGLFDLGGNVWEWCADRYQPGLKQLPDNGEPSHTGIGRTVRGGSWRRTVDLARVSSRSWFDEWYRSDDLGFRCVIPRSQDVSDAAVLATAKRTFALRIRLGHDLAGADLSVEDRRYLDRRAITWLLLEERVSNALQVAVSLLERDPEDPVAVNLLNGLDEQISRAARQGDFERLDDMRNVLARAAAENSWFERRRRELEPRVIASLKACGEAASRSGQKDLARACYAKGLEIAVDDTSLLRGIESVNPRPGEVRILEKDDREMVWIPSGTFRFGASEGDGQADLDEFPAGEFLVQGFWIDRYEVTNGDYRRCVEAGACTPPGQTDAYDDPNRASYPVLWVDWFQARQYARWAGKRLPTEVEWEYAARAGGVERFPWGERWDPSRANGIDIEGTDHWGAEAPVGSFPPNTWGVYDLVGNASEWVQDVYHTSYDGAPRDGRPWEQETGPISERKRVIRGGSYTESASKQRVSDRSASRPVETHRGTGFRCASDG
jgi:formylglycine-generating enzyme required for sulfatase activity